MREGKESFQRQLPDEDDNVEELLLTGTTATAAGKPLFFLRVKGANFC